MRRPAASRRALIWPVKLRRVASGLMIEKVLSRAIMHPLVFRAWPIATPNLKAGIYAALIRQAPAMAQAKNQLSRRKTASHRQTDPALGHLVPSTLRILGKIAQFII